MDGGRWRERSGEREVREGGRWREGGWWTERGRGRREGGREVDRKREREGGRWRERSGQREVREGGRWREGVREGERKVDHGKEGGRWTERGRGKEGGYSSLLLRMSTKFV